MKSLLLPLAACAVLGGCATYGDPYGYGYGYPGTTVYGTYQTAPGYGYGTYGTPVHPYQHDGRRGTRDRDRDGIPNRVDHDRDGDGVPNNQDARPNNPRRW